MADYTLGYTGEEIDEALSKIVDLNVSNLATKTEIETKQNKLTTLGSVSKPIYVSADGTISECNTIPVPTSSIEEDSINVLTSGGAYDLLNYKLYPTHKNLTNGTIEVTNRYNLYSIDISSATTLTINVSEDLLSKYYVTFELRLNMTSVSTVTLPTDVEWMDNNPPDMTDVGVYYFVFRHVPGTSKWIANVQGRWSY